MSHKPIQFTRKAIKLGESSLCVVIPAEIVDALELRERQKLSVELDGETVKITDWEE